MLRETASNFFDSEQEEDRQLRTDADHGNLVEIIQCRDFDVLVKGKKIDNSKDFLPAFSLMLAAKYMFNVTYGSNIASTTILLQKLILGLNDGMKPPSKGLHLITKFKKII